MRISSVNKRIHSIYVSVSTPYTWNLPFCAAYLKRHSLTGLYVTVIILFHVTQLAFSAKT